MTRQSPGHSKPKSAAPSRSPAPDKTPAKTTAGLIIRRVPIGDVELWDRNPRGISKSDFDRLKKQIARLNPYKPLIVTAGPKGKWIVLGGNMRLRALRELGHTAVDVSIVDAPSDARKLEYALSDNDRAGHYDETQLAELAIPLTGEIDVELYKIDFVDPIDLRKVIGKSGPSLPPAGAFEGPNLKADRLVEIYCSSEHLAKFKAVLDEWGTIDGVTVHIS